MGCVTVDGNASVVGSTHIQPSLENSVMHQIFVFIVNGKSFRTRGTAVGYPTFVLLMQTQYLRKVQLNVLVNSNSQEGLSDDNATNIIEVPSHVGDFYLVSHPRRW